MTCDRSPYPHKYAKWLGFPSHFAFPVRGQSKQTALLAWGIERQSGRPLSAQNTKTPALKLVFLYFGNGGKSKARASSELKWRIANHTLPPVVHDLWYHVAYA